MKITTLVENYVEKEVIKSLEAQHGLSLYIEFMNKKILFDTGQDRLFYENALKLNIKIEEIDYLVLSHGHYDHVGGLKYFLELNKSAKIIVSKNILNNIYSKREEGYRYIGIEKKLILENKERIIFVDEYFQLEDNIYFLINKKFKGEPLQGNLHLYMKKEDYILDNFNHEIIMVLEEKLNELIVFTGCSHGGIVNMVESVEEKFKDKKVVGLVGGFHLQNNRTRKLGEPEERVIKMGEDLKKIPQIYTGHCTGKEGFKVLKTVLGNQISEFHVGKIFNL